MAISQADFQKACLTFKLNWPGRASDGKTVAQRLDELQAAVAALAEDIVKYHPAGARQVAARIEPETKEFDA